MLNTIEKRRIKKAIYSKVALIAVIVLLVLIARGTWSVYKKASYARDNEIRANYELQQLKNRNAFLTQELESLNSTRGQEEDLRKKFDVGKEGEKLIVLVGTHESIQTAEPTSPSILDRLKSFFKFTN